MEPFHTNQVPLLSWIDPDSFEQRSWITSYCFKKGIYNISGSQASISGDPHQLIMQFKQDLNNASTRELIRAMRAAWNQKKYRERNGRQVSFQLPEIALRELDQISRVRGQPKTQTLQQIIHDTVEHEKIERSRSKEKIKKLEDKLKKLEEEKLQSESMRNKIINALLKKLVEEVTQSCCYEAVMGPLDDKDLEEVQDSQHKELIKNKIDAIERSIPDMRLLRYGIKPIREFLPRPQGEVDE